MKTPKPKDRRKFLLAAGLGSAGAAAALVAGRPQVESREAEAQAEGDGGYRESEHVQKYYKTAQV